MWELCKRKECTEHEQDGLGAELQRVERERDKYVDVVIIMQNGAGDLQMLVAEDSSAMQQHIKEH